MAGCQRSASPTIAPLSATCPPLGVPQKECHLSKSTAVVTGAKILDET
jgi:hypothetical protein